jgi:predicted RNA-binding Zn ribbon-like protein
MHWQEVAGLRVPVRLSGHPALDFCNTRAGWGEPPDPRGEWLTTYDHLVVWSTLAELTSQNDARRLRRAARRDEHPARAVLSAARRLRSAAYKAVLDPDDRSAAAVVTGYVRRAGSVVRVEPGRPPRWEFPRKTGLDLPLLAIAWTVSDLLTTVDLDRVRTCPGHHCGWLFLDTSGRRRWCSMSSCGNRAKVAAYANRHRSVDR